MRRPGDRQRGPQHLIKAIALAYSSSIGSIPQLTLMPAVLLRVGIARNAQQCVDLLVPDAVVEQALDLVSLAHARGKILVDRREVIKTEGGQLPVAECRSEKIA